MTLIDRARKWGEERDQLWLQKGIERGIEQGIERGMQKGIEHGIEQGIERGVQKGIERERQASVERECELVFRMVSRRFGPGTAERLRPTLAGIRIPEDVVAVADAVIECETGEEFLRRVRDL